MPRNLILAYLATWLIHGSYLGFLLAKYRKTKALTPGEEPSAKD